MTTDDYSMLGDKQDAVQILYIRLLAYTLLYRYALLLPRLWQTTADQRQRWDA